MPRFSPSLALASALLFIPGCRNAWEKAVDRASEAAQNHEIGNEGGALEIFCEVGATAHDDAENDARMRFLAAVAFYRFHRLGLDKSSDACPWAKAVLEERGEGSYLDLAFSELVELEEAQFSREDLPAWMRLDRDLALAETFEKRGVSLAAELPAVVYEENSGYAQGFVRLGTLEVARGFCIQAWQTATAGGLTPEAPRKRISDVYGKMAEACREMAGAKGVSELAKKELEGESERYEALSERSLLLMDTADLNHPTDREMLSLVIKSHLKEARSLAMLAKQESQAGNRARGREYLLKAMAHMVTAMTLGLPDTPESQSAMGWIREIVESHADLAK